MKPRTPITTNPPATSSAAACTAMYLGVVVVIASHLPRLFTQEKYPGRRRVNRRSVPARGTQTRRSGRSALFRAVRRWRPPGGYLLMLQFGGLPQWWPPSHALQCKLHPEPALASDARIVDQLLCCSDHLREWEQSSSARTNINI